MFGINGRVVALALIVAGLTAAGGLDQHQSASLPAITYRDPFFGLPHIYADTDKEVTRENGPQVAKDRLGQLILISRVGRGKLYQAS